MGWMSRRDLLDAGYTVRGIASAVHRGGIIRVRRGHYCTPDVAVAEQRAVRIGGAVTCVSELRRRGIWVLDDGRLHVQLDPGAGRLRDPDERARSFVGSGREVLHWRHRTFGSGHVSHVSALEALLCAARCLEQRPLIASIDSALRMGSISRGDLGRLSAALPQRLRGVTRLVDQRAESGLESIVRVLLRELGLRVSPQVSFPGVGRVDLVVEGWVVVETDGSEFHDVSVAPRDRRRDAILASRGRTVLRFRYAQVVFEPAVVVAAVISAVGVHRRVPNSGRIAARARSRMRRLEIS
jgi:very-short-patch-repair endonuclease